MAAPVITRCRIENLPILAILDRACFEKPLPADDLCGYLTDSETNTSGSFFFGGDQGAHETGIALVLSTYDSTGCLHPVGFLLLVLREELGLIERIGICPEHRGRGLARFILDRVWAESVHLGVSVWGAELQESDFSSQQFFRHLGFLKSCPPVEEGREKQASSTIVMWCPRF